MLQSHNLHKVEINDAAYNSIYAVYNMFVWSFEGTDCSEINRYASYL